MRKNNVLRDLIDDEKPTIGTHLFTQWPGMVEVIGHTGVIDYIELSSPYAPYDLFSLENFGRAVDLFDHMSSIMKLGPGTQDLPGRARNWLRDSERPVCRYPYR